MHVDNAKNLHYNKLTQTFQELSLHALIHGFFDKHLALFTVIFIILQTCTLHLNDRTPNCILASVNKTFQGKSMDVSNFLYG